jgi:sodium transport system permease protein
MPVRWSDVFVLYRWELRSALRDRTIVVNSLIIPIVLYPLLLWAVFTGLAFVQGQTKDLAFRIALGGMPPGHDELRRRFASDERLLVATAPLEAGEAEARVRARQLDAAVRFFPVDDALSRNFRAEVVYDASRERSVLARSRVEIILGRYRDTWLREQAAERGMPPTLWTGFAIERRDTASGRDVGTFLLGLLLPLFFVVMVALGCLNPAIDLTAGERERNTWETLMTTAASRWAIVAAKYLVVTTLGGAAGLLNVVAMMMTLRGVLAPLLGASSREALAFRLAPVALPVLVVGAVLLAALLAAGMMLVAAFARSFREGQSMVGPLYLVAIAPALFLGTPGIELTPSLAAVPVVNVALVVREAINGVFKPVESLVAAGTTLFVVALVLRLTTRVLAVEQVMVGSYSGGLLTFLRDRQRWHS